MYINLHVLYSLAGANPNRDDTGAPKTLVYGGVERSRISSQAMTRAKRRAYETDPDGELSYRSTQLADEIASRAAKLIVTAGGTVDDATATALQKAAAKAVTSLTAKDAKDAADSENTNAPKATLVWLAEREINDAAAALASKTVDLTADLIAKTQTASLSIAGFGRMFANRPDLQTEAAIQRADAFTTHRGDIDVDYFTTVDDLTSGKGAGHLGTKLNTGGVYYWHANINTDELLANWTDADSEHAETRLTALIRALIIALPTGGENTHAHHALPVAVLAVPATRPVSLQNAFETPVTADRDGGYLPGSLTALADEHAAATRYTPSTFPLTAISATLKGTPIAGSDTVNNLDDLAATVARWILDSKR